MQRPEKSPALYKTISFRRRHPSRGVGRTRCISPPPMNYAGVSEPPVTAGDTNTGPRAAGSCLQLFFLVWIQ
ncbi:hypothetical protein SKAU_G00318450 [Synaphobranchus kaupii]|uniref:Uncharacterized protein n=1 Tax=Synaphobranchus kaupii TaxID=118154 RepID=A0A9Q1IL07_SYNKA|nr:hypothetical protein SKAU_G00318450 [Synaphobranchus kaupii]